MGGGFHLLLEKTEVTLRGIWIQEVGGPEGLSLFSSFWLDGDHLRPERREKSWLRNRAHRLRSPGLCLKR